MTDRSAENVSWPGGSRAVPEVVPSGTVLVDPQTGHRYSTGAKLGQGAFGTVCRGTRIDPLPEVDVAIKHLRKLDGPAILRFAAEAEAVRRLCTADGEAGRWIAPCLASFSTSSDDHWIVSEFVPGTNLRKLVLAKAQQHATVSVRHALKLARSVLDGLELVHAQGIVHRDVKPANLIHETRTDDLYRVRILDFGIAHLPADARLTESDILMGTPHFAAPESLLDAGRVDHRADIYSWGEVLFFLLTKYSTTTPLGNRVADLRRFVVDANSDSRLSLCDVRPNVPSKLGELVAWCTEHDRERRPKSVSELRTGIDDLERRFDAARIVQRELASWRKAMAHALEKYADDSVQKKNEERSTSEFVETLRQTMRRGSKAGGGTWCRFDPGIHPSDPALRGPIWNFEREAGRMQESIEHACDYLLFASRLSDPTAALDRGVRELRAVLGEWNWQRLEHLLGSAMFGLL